MVVQNKILAFEFLINKCALTNEDLKELFGVSGNGSIAKIKRPALALMAEKGISTTQGCLHLQSAYEAWGLDVDELEQNYAKAKKYGLA